MNGEHVSTTVRTEPRSSQAFSNIIPRRRKKPDQPVPRTIVGSRPLITLDADSLKRTALAFTVSPEAGRQTLAPLKADNAIAASDNATAVRTELEDRQSIRSEEAEDRISTLEPRLEEVSAQLLACRTQLASIVGPLGFRISEGRSCLEFLGNEPVSLEELAGKHLLPPPEESTCWAHRTGYRLVAAIGGGTLFGISLGLLAGKLELFSLADEWPWLVLWATLGISLMSLVGASLQSVGKSLGDQLYRRAIRTSWIQSAQIFLTTVLLLGLLVAFAMIESRVEQLGFFKALSEQSSLKGFEVKRADMFWVSLMLVVPTVAYYVIQGFGEGERLGNLAHLKHLQFELRQEIRSKPEFAFASALLSRIQSLDSIRAGLEQEISVLRSQIGAELSMEEKQRLEDMEMDAAMASYDAEDFMIASIHTPPRTQSSNYLRKVMSWIQAGLRSWNRNRWPRANGLRERM